MQQRNRWMIGILIIASLLTAVACTATSSRATKEEPATVEPIEGTDLSRVILTAKASERLGIETALVRQAEVGPAGGEAALRKVIPYAAVLYDPNGNTFVYTNGEPFTFVRAPITVDYIEGELAILHDGPPSGTAVVTVGAAELYGTEFGVGK